MAKKIQDPDFWYSILLPYVNWHTRRSYSRFEVHGKKRIPKGGALIFGVNHSNTLMDALVLLSADNIRKVFIARGDIFKNPAVAKILNFMRILPIFRIRNGVAAVRQNDESLNKAVDVIHDHVDLYLFPEGTHRTKHSLMRMGKGLFHIAVDANKQFGDKSPVYIIPTAIEYGDYFRFRSTAMINFGEPINVTEFFKNTTEENEAANINLLKDKLHEEISKLFTYIPDNEDYDAIWEIVKMKNEKRAGSLYKKMLRNRATVEKVLKYKEEQPEEAKKLFERVMEFSKHRLKEKVSVMSVAKKRPLLSGLGCSQLARVAHHLDHPRPPERPSLQQHGQLWRQVCALPHCLYRGHHRHVLQPALVLGSWWNSAALLLLFRVRRLQRVVPPLDFRCALEHQETLA